MPGYASLLLAGVVVALYGPVNSARADVTLQVDEGNILGATVAYQLDGVNYGAHQIGRLSVTSVSGSSQFANGESFYAFCVELTQNRYNADHAPGSPLPGYVETTDIASVPRPGGLGGNLLANMGAGKAVLIKQLFNSWFSTKGWSDFSAIDATAFQLAIWEILYDSVPGDPSSLNISAGAFQAILNVGNPVQAEIKAKVDSWLSNLGNFSTDIDLLAFTNDLPGSKKGEGLQDLITTGGEGDVQGAPVPPALVLALAGLAGVGGFGWRRRKVTA